MYMQVLFSLNRLSDDQLYFKYTKIMEHIIIMLCVAVRTSATFREGVFHNIQREEAATGIQHNTSAQTGTECGIK